jgi:hypothetical protein
VLGIEMPANLADSPSKPERVAAILGVVDEVELIGDGIANLRNIGVDHIMVVDGGSVDGTLDVLSSYKGDSDITVHYCSLAGAGRLESLDFLTPAYQAALEMLQPDLLLLLDADEFWIPASGSIRDIKNIPAGKPLRVPRYNIPIVRGTVPDIAAIVRSRDEMFLITDPMEDGKAALDHSEVPWIMTAVQPKLLFRPEAAISIKLGGHGLLRDGKGVKDQPPTDLVIAHAPFTSLERFVRKVKNIQATLAAGSHLLTGSQAWHWKRWASILEEGSIEAEYERQCLSTEQFNQYVSAGVIETVTEYFRKMASASPGQP